VCGGACTGGTTTFGASCGACGGTIQCGGACSNNTPHDTACGPCNDGNSVCGGACTGGTGNFGAGCGVCGGTVQCGGACSNNTPHDTACGRCNTGDSVCGGACGGEKPAGYSVVTSSDDNEFFTCCSLNYNKTFGSSCNTGSSGYVHNDCQITTGAGQGGCVLVSQGDCQCTVHFYNVGTSGNNCEVKITKRLQCDN
jgi:hypothetical protein